MTGKLNIVLVHGAFGDGSHWRHIIPGLYEAGHRAVAAQNPLTSLVDDVANTRKLAEWMGGPTLLDGSPYRCPQNDRARWGHASFATRPTEVLELITNAADAV